MSATDIPTGLDAEKRFVQQAEERLAVAKRNAMIHAAVFVVIVCAWLFMTRASVASGKLTQGRRSLVVLAGAIFVGARAATSIRHAKSYLDSSRRALADAEAGVVLQENFCG